MMLLAISNCSTLDPNNEVVVIFSLINIHISFFQYPGRINPYRNSSVPIMYSACHTERVTERGMDIKGKTGRAEERVM